MEVEGIAVASGRSSVAVVLPGEGAVGISTHFPESLLISYPRGDLLDRLGAFPGIPLRDDHANRASVFLCERSAVPFVCE